MYRGDNANMVGPEVVGDGNTVGRNPATVVDTHDHITVGIVVKWVRDHARERLRVGHGGDWSGEVGEGRC